MLQDDDDTALANGQRVNGFMLAVESDTEDDDDEVETESDGGSTVLLSEESEASHDDSSDESSFMSVFPNLNCKTFDHDDHVYPWLVGIGNHDDDQGLEDEDDSISSHDFARIFS